VADTARGGTDKQQQHAQQQQHAYQCRSMLSEGWNFVQLLVTLLWCAEAAADCPSTAITAAAAAAAAALVGVALQVYEGLAALHGRDFKQAADLLLDSIATFTT